MRILITGGAGLVGRSLLGTIDHGKHLVTVIDKDARALNFLKKEYPSVEYVHSDLGEEDALSSHHPNYDIVVLLQAQIKGLYYSDFEKNTILSTQNLITHLSKQEKIPYVIHVSSSVINSKADDFYTRSKRKQEDLVRASIFKHIILRPTLMYGEGDSKHFYVLLKLMHKLPFFPMPGLGHFIRQPLFANDFAGVINDCIEKPKVGTFNISGLELITFKDCLIRFRRRYNIFSVIVPIPLFFFRMMLKVVGKVLKNPPFTSQQLDALVIPETFERIDWPKIFSTTYTTFDDGIKQFDYKIK